MNAKICGMKKVRVPKMIRATEAARLCGVSRQAIYNYVHAGWVGIDQEAYDRYGVILIDRDDVLRVSKEKQELREIRHAEKPGRKSKSE